MFTRNEKYNDAVDARIVAEEKYKKLKGTIDSFLEILEEKNLIDIAFGRMAFNNMSNEDVVRLIRLCHPDKHHNSDMSVDMTTKLLKLKENFQNV